MLITYRNYANPRTYTLFATDIRQMQFDVNFDDFRETPSNTWIASIDKFLTEDFKDIDINSSEGSRLLKFFLSTIQAANIDTVNTLHAVDFSIAKTPWCSLVRCNFRKKAKAGVRPTMQTWEQIAMKRVKLYLMTAFSSPTTRYKDLDSIDAAIGKKWE
jgi:hypothetical protein